MANDTSESGRGDDQARRRIQSSIEQASKVGRTTLAATTVLLVVAVVCVAYVALHACSNT